MLTDKRPEQPAEEQEHERQAEGEGGCPAPLQQLASTCLATQLSHHRDGDVIGDVLALEGLLDEIVELLVGKRVIVCIHDSWGFYGVNIFLGVIIAF